MAYVKIINNKETGVTILPSYFPIGIIARRFGEVEQVTNRVSKLTNIDRYLVLEGDKLVLKKIKSVDKQSFLTSFTMRIEEQLDRTNDFTTEYEIFPSDLYFEEDLKQETSQNNLADSKDDNLDNQAEEQINIIYSDSKTAPIDLYMASKPLSSQQEEMVLKASINYYLTAIGLRPIDEQSNHYPLHFLSTKGDALLNYALLDYFTNRKALKQLVTNESMRLALGRLGFYEFLEADSHLAGTFFEVIYACAMLQNEHDIRKKMEQILVGEEAFKTKLPKPKFKGLD